ncbi:molybdopterin-dependent oxidoreductase [Solirubrobacter ginsenosidimutans]|uniref:Molybdopterin-dependent oxidoreductase n=1 Tax=Solirubrobacter ginsenosidimutans TaxID=490573 RepID=A0A9X3MSF0_9ACTN|nr:molybdopterin-dependent oxidoreductase [Solirubrobacter ginsenosidimutans]MDA0158783.1 molybdopterin-dependent oxidoreductase [Solirubrobacter ginsenosidimutans]
MKGSERQARTPTFCALCVSRCGATAVTVDGRFTALEPDPAHPTGRALCVKGKAAPAIVGHADRVLHPLRRTAPKGAEDPAWERISWDDAIDTVAARLSAIATTSGPESVVFAAASPSTSAISDSVDWIVRLRRAFGSPNFTCSMELCGWGRYLASMYTFGAPVPGAFMPDLERAGCILYWGYNPSVARLVHATATVDARRRGAKLVAIDPRRAGLASSADHWLRVRPGSDGALAIAIVGVLLERGFYDVEFVRRWTNAPLLVRADTGRLLRSEEAGGAEPGRYVAWDAVAARPVSYDPTTRSYGVDEARLALEGRYTVGGLECRPVLAELADHCREYTPDAAAEITGVPAADIARVAETLWTSRPVAFYTWSGLEQHSGTTQTIRAINVLYALLGCLDAPGGNVLFTPVPTNPVDGLDLLAPEQRAKAFGLDERPLGPARFEFTTGSDFYAAALDGRARALVNFGANLVVAQGDSARGRDALTQLDFAVHADTFLSPTADLADIVLPVATPFEVEALRIGFEVNQQAQSLVQLRRPVQPPRGEARSDLEIVFALAKRLGLGAQFWDGDIDAAWRHQLAPSGITLEQLRAQPAGIALPLKTVHRKHARIRDGIPAGFRTPSGKVELLSETLAEHGHPALPTFTEPAISPRSRPDLAVRYPLVLTCAKSVRFAESQHRQIATLRRATPDPQLELHPDAAAARAITAGDWVRIVTPNGAVRARARLNSTLDPGVVCGQHGWWQGCAELGLPGYPPYGPDSANLNLILRQEPSDPVSGSAPLRASLCEVERIDTQNAATARAAR